MSRANPKRPTFPRQVRTGDNSQAWIETVALGSRATDVAAHTRAVNAGLNSKGRCCMVLLVIESE
jgi:hypothetical protein